MKMKDNCRLWHPNMECPHLRRPVFHSGYTGKSGPETWWRCLRHKKPVHNVKRCDFAGNPEKWREWRQVPE